MSYLQKILVVAAALMLAACGQPDSETTDQAAAGQAGLDMSLAPNKVTADDYRHEPLPVEGESVTSVNANGEIAPFGMASRSPREIAPAPAAGAATIADTSGGGQSAVYAAQCVACHGPDAQGVEGLGLNLVTSELVANSSVAELVAFLTAGRMPDSPDSVSGVPMPAFAWMPPADLEEVAAYLKTL